MKTHDPFLRHLSSAVDRIVVWCVLAFVLSALAWSAACYRGLGLPALDAWRTLLALAAHGGVDRTATTVLVMAASIGMLGATIIGGYLFRRWKRQGRPDAPLRGTRWEHEA